MSNNNHTAVKLEGAALCIRGNGNYLGEGYWNYIHVDTPEAMAAESVSPSENSNAVSTSKAVRIKFNNIIDPDNMGDISFKSADGAEVIANVKIYDGRTLVITPSSALSENTAYTVSVSGAKDLFGSAADASTSFTTGDKYHIHYDFDDVTAKSGHYFSQGTGNAAAMTWKQDTADGRQVLNGTVSAASEALSFENLPGMDNVICELSAALPAANPAYQIGLRPVGNSRQWTSGVRMTRTQHFLLDGTAADKNLGYAVTWDKFYRIGFGYNKATKTATYYVIENNGTTYTKEVAMNGDYLQGASVYLRGDSASAQTGYYDYLYIDKAEKLEAKDVKTLNSGIRAEYNNVLVPSGIKAVYKDNYGNEAEGTVSVSNGNILSVTAPAKLKAGRIYTLTVSGIKDETVLRQIKGNKAEYVKTGKKLLEDYHDIYTYEGIVTGVGESSITGESAVGDDEAMIGSEVFVCRDMSLRDFLGSRVKIYYGDEERNILSVRQYGNNILKINADDIDSFKSGRLSYYDGSKLKSVKISVNVDVLYNDRCDRSFRGADFKIENGTVTLTDNNSDGTYEFADIREPKIGVVSGTDTKKDVIYFKYKLGSTLTLKPDSITGGRGEEIDIRELMAGDVLCLYMSRDMSYINAALCTDTVDGKITDIQKDGDKTEICVNGVRFKVLKSCAENQSEYIKTVCMPLFILTRHILRILKTCSPTAMS